MVGSLERGFSVPYGCAEARKDICGGCERNGAHRVADLVCDWRNERKEIERANDLAPPLLLLLAPLLLLVSWNKS